MNMPIKTGFAITALSLLIHCSLIHAQDASTPAQQSERLQGTWEGVEVGREAQGKCTMTITGNAIHFQGADKNEWYKAAFTLPAGTDPKQLHATITECPQPDFVGKSAFSIYKFEEGKLTLVGHRPGAPDVPKSFEGDAGTRSFVFKKAQAQKENSEPSKPK